MSYVKRTVVGEIQFRGEPTNIDDADWSVSISDGDQITFLKVRLACCQEWWSLMEPKLHIFPITFFCSQCGKNASVPPPVSLDVYFELREPEPEIEDALIGVIKWVEKENINEHIILK